jgi:hypothetical protein
MAAEATRSIDISVDAQPLSSSSSTDIRIASVAAPLPVTIPSRIDRPFTFHFTLPTPTELVTAMRAAVVAGDRTKIQEMLQNSSAIAYRQDLIRIAFNQLIKTIMPRENRTAIIQDLLSLSTDAQKDKKAFIERLILHHFPDEAWDLLCETSQPNRPEDLADYINLAIGQDHLGFAQALMNKILKRTQLDLIQKILIRQPSLQPFVYNQALELQYEKHTPEQLSFYQYIMSSTAGSRVTWRPYRALNLYTPTS